VCDSARLIISAWLGKPAQLVISARLIEVRYMTLLYHHTPKQQSGAEVNAHSNAHTNV
jgi:hypothetical protein